MDPRNFLTEDSIFQFESLEYQEGEQTKSGVENVLKNTPMYKTEYTYINDSGAEQTITYSQTFMEAAASSGVSPYHLASRVKQEVVTGTTTMSSSVSGTVKGYEGIYNFYNIGANNSTKSGGAVANGLAWANKDTTYLRPWNTIYKAIVGGAQYLGSNYINVGQNTLYLQKFNVTSTSTYNHQYMANIEAPASEALKTATAYGDDKADMSIVFSIPVYSGMPSEVCPEPSGDSTSSNNYLKTLKVKGHTFRTPFQTGDDGSTIYSVTVAHKVSSVKINATPVTSTAKVTGTGSKKLKTGTKTYTIKVKAESGSIRRYKIKITRKKK
jgi:beta-N-acetylglucosaminidase